MEAEDFDIPSAQGGRPASPMVGLYDDWDISWRPKATVSNLETKAPAYKSDLVSKAERIVHECIKSTNNINTLAIKLAVHMDKDTPPSMVQVKISAHVGDNLDHFQPRHDALVHKLKMSATREYNDICREFLNEKEQGMRAELQAIMKEADEVTREKIKDCVTKLTQSEKNRLEEYKKKVEQYEPTATEPQSQSQPRTKDYKRPPKTSYTRQYHESKPYHGKRGGRGGKFNFHRY